MLTNFLNETQGFTNTLKVLGVHVDSIDVELRSRIEQSLEIQEFQLGFGFLVDQYLYIIGQGRVRLVSFSPEKQRDVSILTLGAEQSFGLEQLFYQADTDFLPYRAIAASSGLVTRIAIANIQEWLPQIPNLDAQIRQQVEEKQSLISAKILPQALPDIKFSPISPSSQWAEIKGAINLSQTKQANLHLSLSSTRSPKTEK